MKVRQSAANDNRQVNNAVTVTDFTGLGLAANDNKPLTIAKITADIRAQRVYNLEINSRDGEITHNYVVGDDLAWVHNAVRGRPAENRKPHKKRKPKGPSRDRHQGKTSGHCEKKKQHPNWVPRKGK